ncbi:MAG: hypothetical protein HY828_14985 [Actinobacteria bacterium]|nr:hypothetical protein [Actinomycetota bacterium]
MTEPLPETKDTLARWRAALAQGDEDEVARLVRLSRADRNEIATSGQLGAMLGQVDPTSCAPREW